MNSSALTCGSCQQDSKNEKAVIWCVNCNEGLCGICADFHKRMKTSRDHKTVNVDCLETNKSFINEMTLNCKRHEQELDLFCPNHLAPCCMTCVSLEHSNCTGIISLRSAAEAHNSGSVADGSEQDVQNTLHLFNKLKENRINNLERLKQQKTDIKQSLADMKDDLIKKFEEFEGKIINDIEKIVNCEEVQITDLIGDIEERIKQLNITKINQDSAEKFGSAEHFFLWKLENEQKLCKQKEYLAKILEDDAAFEIDIDFQQNISVDFLLPKSDSIVNFKVLKSACSIMSEKEEIEVKSSAQTASGYLPSANDIQIDFQGYIDIPESSFVFGRNVSTIAKISRNTVAVCDSNNELLLLDVDNRVSSEVDIPGNPWAVSQIEEATFAVTYPQECAVKLISVTDLSLIRIIEINGKCRGLCSDGSRIVLGVGDNEMQILDLEGNILNSFSVRGSGPIGLRFIHMDQNHLYWSDTANKIQCLDLSGELIWEFQDSILKSPRGMCCDQYGNLFVVGLESNNIFCINRDGKHGKEIYNLKNEIQKPKAICFDKNASCLYITNERGEALSLYHVTYYH